MINHSERLYSQNEQFYQWTVPIGILGRNCTFSGFYTFIIKYILSIYPLPETTKKKSHDTVKSRKAIFFIRS